MAYQVIRDNRAIKSLPQGKNMDIDDIKIAIVGLGYVGLPLAVEFSKVKNVVGFDIVELSIHSSAILMVKCLQLLLIKVLEQALI